MKRTLLALNLFCLLAFSSQNSAQTAEEIAAIKEKSKPCVACHNEDGNSVNPAMPKLAGQYEAYFVKQLKDFKLGESGPRPNLIMMTMVSMLSDKDIADLAVYYESQKETIGVTKQAYLALGEKVYRGGNLQTGVVACSSCHGPKGEGNKAANFPRISGQHAQYISDQLNAFKDGKRRNSPNGMMEAISKRMSPEEIQAVSSYIEGLH